MLTACLREPSHAVLLNRVLELLLPLGVDLDHDTCNAVPVREVPLSWELAALMQLQKWWCRSLCPDLMPLIR